MVKPTVTEHPDQPGCWLVTLPIRRWIGSPIEMNTELVWESAVRLWCFERLGQEGERWSEQWERDQGRRVILALYDRDAAFEFKMRWC